MNEIISHAAAFLEHAGFEWAICGGGAVDLLAGRDTRPHQDVDISVFWEDRDQVIAFVLNSDWLVFEACGGGQVRQLFEAQEERSERRNLYCFPNRNAVCRLTPLGDDCFGFDLGFAALTEFNYAEFLFNRRDGDCFCYRAQRRYSTTARSGDRGGRGAFRARAGTRLALQVEFLPPPSRRR